MAKILIVDDEPAIRSLLRTVLERTGFVVEEAADGAEALRAQRRAPADLVITDLVMPDMEGIETIRELRRLDPRVKVIAISGGGIGQAPIYLELAREMGAARTFAKPFELPDVRDAARELLGIGEPSPT